MRSYDIVDLVKAAGVVGAGGAGFPTHVKLAGPADTVIINGAECEPLLRVDQLLGSSVPDKIIRGVIAAMESTGAGNAIIGLKAKYISSRDALTCAISDARMATRIVIGLLPDVYPAGDEHVLVYELTGKLIPQGGLPKDIGVVVVNMETVYNIAEAIDNIPVTYTWLTIGGEVSEPWTLPVPVGTPIGVLLGAMGITPSEDYVLLEGGPMMGTVVSSWNKPVTKLTKGLLRIPRDLPFVAEKISPLLTGVYRGIKGCDQCRLCSDICPRHLLGHGLSPHLVMRALRTGSTEPDYYTQVFLCSECGLCSVVACPASLWPRRLNAELKREFRRQGYPVKPVVKPDIEPRTERAGRMIPTTRLVKCLGLGKYNIPTVLRGIFDDVDEVVIPLHQHAGTRAKPVVVKGETVRRGQCIGEADGVISARIHSSIDGAVIEVGESIHIRRH